MRSPFSLFFCFHFSLTLHAFVVVFEIALYSEMVALRFSYQCIFLAFYLTSTQFQASGNIRTKLKYFETLRANDIHTITKRSVDNNPQSHLKFVNLKGLGRDFSFYLQSSPSILTSDFRAFSVDADGRQTAVSINKNSFYTGALRDEPASHVEAIWEDNDLLATITVPNEIYTIEPAWRHLPYSTNHSMIIYKASDVIKSFKNLHYPHQKICGFKEGVTVSDNEYEESLAESNDYRTSGSENDSLVYHQHHYHQPKHRTKRNIDLAHNTCELMVVADYRFYSGVGNNNVVNTANYLIHIFRKVDVIYRTTLWDKKAGLINYGIKIKNMKIHREYSRNSDDYNYNKTWEITPFLHAFSSKVEFNKYCLAHLFTYQKFNDGVLGLAYIASSRRHTYGGICSPLYRKQTNMGIQRLTLNTGWSSSMNTYGARILTQEADLVTAHEIGHNWGSEHDPGEGRCAPSSFDNGKYIMYPYAVSGYETNNQKFSPCSKKYISAVLISKASTCFSVMEQPFGFCGDGKVNKSLLEECDAGFLEELNDNPCCTSTCKLKPYAKCSPANHECCTNDCQKSKKGETCRSTIGNNEGCLENSQCDGINLSCPEAKKKRDYTPCLDNGQCVNGVCLSYCESRSMQPCICDNITDACIRCCMTNGECKPINKKDILPNGRPCVQGYCVQGKCKKAVKNLVHRLFSIFEIITSDRLVEFMRSNIVGTVIVFSLILWIPSSCAISCYDKKQIKKEKKFREWNDPDNKSLYTNDDPNLRIHRTESYKQRFVGSARPVVNYPYWNTPSNIAYEQETTI